MDSPKSESASLAANCEGALKFTIVIGAATHFPLLLVYVPEDGRDLGNSSGAIETKQPQEQPPPRADAKREQESKSAQNNNTQRDRCDCDLCNWDCECCCDYCELCATWLDW